eukprot:745628-Hanusia_phi.AAC.2
MLVNALVKVSGCELRNFTRSVLFTDSKFIRTVRAELRNCSVAGLMWLNGVKPKRLLQRNVIFERAHLDWSKSLQSRNRSAGGRQETARAMGRKKQGEERRMVKSQQESEAKCQKQMQQLLASVKELMKKGIVEGELMKPYSWRVADKYRVDKEEEKFWDGDKSSKYYQDPRYRDLLEITQKAMERNESIEPDDDFDDYDTYLSKYLRGGGGEVDDEEGQGGGWEAEGNALLEDHRLRQGTRGEGGNNAEWGRTAVGGGEEGRGGGGREETGGGGKGGGEDGQEKQGSGEEEYSNEELVKKMRKMSGVDLYEDERSCAPLHPRDAFARGFLALIHGENITSLHLTEEERKVEAAKWEVCWRSGSGDMGRGRRRRRRREEQGNQVEEREEG